VNEPALNLCTLFDQNFLVQGISMIRSVEQFATAKIRWTVLALDQETYNYLKSWIDFDLEILTLDSIADIELKLLRGTRPWNQLCWTSAACLLNLVNSRTEEGEIAAYIDADCLFFHDIFKTLEPLLHGSSIAIHEHRFSTDRAEWLQRSGRFNVGLVAGVHGTEFDACVFRWRLQVLDNCEVDQSSGKCGDQTYLNEWPYRYKDMAILNNDGIGVAPWNLNNYHISKKNKIIYVGTSPLQFFHFHGLEIGYINSKFAFYVPAAGYRLQKNNYKYIYQEYMKLLTENLSFINNRNVKSYKRGVRWWVTGLIKNRLMMYVK